MSDKVLQGLYKLDPNNDNHWTMEGLAKLDTVKFLSGVSITREELDKIAPGYNRQAMRDYLAANKTETPNATAQGPESAGAGAGIVDRDDSVTKQPEVENGTNDREAEIKSLAEKIASTDEAILKVKRVQNDAREELEELEIESNRLRDRLTEIDPPPTHQENIKRYLESVRLARYARSDARAKLVNSGIDIQGLQALAAPAPIDRSLKTRRR